MIVSTLQIATVGKDPEGIVVGIREFSVTKLVLLYTPAEIEDSHDLAQRIAPLRLDIERHIIKDDPLISTLREVTRVLRDDGPKFDDVLVNISSGSRLMVISTLCAAYINGARTVYVSNRTIIELPILKFGYSEQLSDSKIGILAAIEAAGGEVSSLSALSRSSNVEKSLLSYHLRGGRDTKGLEELGLVSIKRLSQGRLGIELTPIGKLILMGREN
jgi:DNA-binding transcriptional ArsR family regulator